MIDSLVGFVQANPLIFIIVIALYVITFIIKAVIKWVLQGVLIVGFVVLALNFIPDDSVKLQDTVLSQVEAKDYASLQRFVQSTDSATVKNTGNGGFTASSEGVQIVGNYDGDSVKVINGIETHVIALTPELKKYIESLHKN